MRTFSRITTVGLAFACILLALPAASLAGHHEGVAKEIKDLTYAAWQADLDEDFEAGMAILADDYTEFNGAFPTRIDGAAMSGRLYKPQLEAEGMAVAAEMANAKVQVYGDVAILSYNYHGLSKNKDGEVEPNLAKSTRVYAKIDGEWKLVHANFAPVSSGN